MFLKNLILVFFFCNLFILNVFCQKAEIGFGAGVGNYKGDLAPKFDFRNTRGGGELFFKYNPSHIISWRLGVNFLGIKADDKWSNDPFLQQRNFNFKANVREVSGRLEYNFFNFRRINKRRFEKWCPFIFGGLNVAQFSGTNSSVGRYRGTMVNVPFGAGLKHYLNPKWNLNFEVGARMTFIDNLDGFVQGAVKYQKINTNNKDMYYYAGISISYVFIGVRCPEQFR